MTYNQTHDAGVAAILDFFKNGALMMEEADLYMEREMGFEGRKMITQSLKDLDAFGPNGRDPLIPLLDDPAPAVRIWAAAALIKIIPDRALAVLYEFRDRSLYDGRMQACRLLILHEQGFNI